MRLPRTSTSTSLPDKPRTMPSAPNADSHNGLTDRRRGSRSGRRPPGCRRGSITDAISTRARRALRRADRRLRRWTATGARPCCARCSTSLTSASAFVRSRVTTSSTCARASRRRSASLSSWRLRMTASRSASRASRSSSARRCSGQRVAFRAQAAFSLLDRRQFAIDAREVRGQQRFASRAAALRVGDDGGRHAEPARDFQRQAAAGRAVPQLIGRRECVGVESKRGDETPSVVAPYDFSASSCVVATTIAPRLRK